MKNRRIDMLFFIPAGGFCYGLFLVSFICRFRSLIHNHFSLYCFADNSKTVTIHSVFFFPFNNNVFKTIQLPK